MLVVYWTGVGINRRAFPNSITSFNEQFDLCATEKLCAQKQTEVWRRPQGHGAGGNKNRPSQWPNLETKNARWHDAYVLNKNYLSGRKDGLVKWKACGSITTYQGWGEALFPHSANVLYLSVISVIVRTGYQIKLCLHLPQSSSSYDYFQKVTQFNSTKLGRFLWLGTSGLLCICVCMHVISSSLHYPIWEPSNVALLVAAIVSTGPRERCVEARPTAICDNVPTGSDLYRLWLISAFRRLTSMSLFRLIVTGIFVLTRNVLRFYYL